LRAGYRAVLCGAEISVGQGSAVANASSAAALKSAVDGITNIVGVAITGYVPGPAMGVRAGTIYWTTAAATGIPASY